MKAWTRRLLPSIRTWKAVLAAVVSWVIASRIGSEHPFFAPLAAILCLQVTVEKSIRIGFQRMLGIVVGVILASVFVHGFGMHWWSLALLLLIGFTIGQAFRLPQYTYMQIGTSALLVLTVGTELSYGIDRIVETLIGAVVAIVVNMTVLPPDYSRRSESGLREAASDLASFYRQYAEWVRAGAPESVGGTVRRSVLAVADDLQYASSKLEQAMHALKFSPFTHRRRKRLAYLRTLLDTLMLGCIHGLELQRLVFEASRITDLKESDRSRWGTFFADFADYIDRWKDEAIPGNVPKPTRLMKMMERDRMTAEDYASASSVQARRLLHDFGCVDDTEEERFLPEVRLALGKESDSKGRRHDLFED